MNTKRKNEDCVICNYCNQTCKELIYDISCSYECALAHAFELNDDALYNWVFYEINRNRGPLFKVCNAPQKNSDETPKDFWLRAQMYQNNYKCQNDLHRRMKNNECQVVLEELQMENHKKINC